MPHTHMHALLTYFRYSVSKIMKVIVSTFLISLGNVPNFTSALVSITAQSAGAKEWIQLKKKKNSPGSFQPPPPEKPPERNQCV